MHSAIDDMPEYCKCCGLRPPAGYVPRYGIYLPNLCVPCYRKHPEEKADSQRNRSCIGGHKAAAK